MMNLAKYVPIFTKNSKYAVYAFNIFTTIKQKFIN